MGPLARNFIASRPDNQTELTYVSLLAFSHLVDGNGNDTTYFTSMNSIQAV
jgi:hypothetical protein